MAKEVAGNLWVPQFGEDLKEVEAVAAAAGGHGDKVTLDTEHDALVAAESTFKLAGLVDSDNEAFDD